MGSRELYKRRERTRLVIGAILVAGIIAIVLIAAAYSPS